MPWGLSSLGRLEGRVMPNLDAVIATLTAVCQPQEVHLVDRPPVEAFFEGDRLLQKHTEEIFGKTTTARRIRIMVTLPTLAAEDYQFVRDLLQRGADCVRINCAHDSSAQWEGAIANVRRAEREIGRSCKVLMDLSGPKPRTGKIIASSERKEVLPGDTIFLARNLAKAKNKLEQRSTDERKDSDRANPQFLTSCSIPEILDSLTVGCAVWIDDGKIGTQVVDRDKNGVWLRVISTPPKGAKLKPDKGLNFPDTVLNLSPLTDKDYRDLDFVATHADIVGYSFVQKAEDIELLQQALSERLGQSSPIPAIVAKIETPESVRNLPELIVRAAGKQSFGVMIARGDLAVEIGYQRLAEIQEEILWLCEAARVPTIWATQVLESLVKKGVPSRGDITDAAMAERAECVMLNKGEFIAEAVTILDDVLTRMQEHQLKKTPQLRALHSWS
jgi:pyruvate kinase